MKKIAIISLLLLSKIGYSQLVINEVYVKPGGSSTSQAVQSLKVCSQPTFGEEFIEIYNPDPCQTIDISCYFIASSAWSSTTNGTFRFPVGTTIGPLGHVSIGGPNSGATFNMYNYCGDPHLDTGSDRWYLDNGDMYIALYDNTGSPVNTVFWTSGGGEANKWGTDSDLDEAPEYAPIGVSCSDVTSLPFPTTNIDYAGGSPALGSSLSRTTDGSATWGEATPTVNNCNNGNCNTATPFNVATNVSQPTCGNTDGSITLTPNPAGTYTYIWTPNVSSTNTATNLDAGTYQINVGDGNCTWDTTITLTAPAPFNVAANVSQPTCGNIDGSITLTPNPAGTYTYIWTPNVSSTNTATNLDAGTYQINVDDGNCTWDTTITLDTPTNCGCVNPFTLTIDSTSNTVCNGSSACNYNGPSILINEINLVPTIDDGSLFGETGLAGKEGEWIELYNPNWCDSIDISGYLLGSFNSTGSIITPASDGMGYQIPQGTVVPPLGFVIIRGSNAPVPPSSAIDIVVNDNGGNLCVDGNTRIWFQNAGGWFGFYDQNGIAQDIVQWRTPTSISDLNASPCIPTNSSATNLVSANASGISYNLGVTPSSGQTYVRIPDGGNWSNSTQSENSSYGTCNDLINGCVVSSGGETSCNGSATVSITGGTPPFTFLWDDAQNQTTQTADSLCPGTYTVVVTDSTGECTQTISVTINDDSEINFTAIVNEPSCANNDGEIILSNNSTGNYVYNWNPSVSIDSIANDLSSGTYNVEVSLGNCSWDSTFTLTSPSVFTTVANVIQPTCENSDGSISLTPSTNGNYTYNWTPNVSSSQSATNLNGGTYNITISNGNCSIDTSFNLTNIGTIPTPEFITTISDSLCSLTGETENMSSGASTYEWFIDGVSQGQSETISFLFEDDLTHTITLEATSVEGCINSVSNQITFNYFDIPLFIPNVFTPNEDGKNDTWYVVGNCIKEYECLIFNRWGNKLYHMTNINDRWDGTYNGTPVPQGVYVYVLKATKSDGSKVIKHGNITKL